VSQRGDFCAHARASDDASAKRKIRFSINCGVYEFVGRESVPKNNPS
jgi:hypothetical protein